MDRRLKFVSRWVLATLILAVGRAPSSAAQEVDRRPAAPMPADLPIPDTLPPADPVPPPVVKPGRLRQPAPAPVDHRVIPVEAAPEGNPLPPAAEKAGAQAPPAAMPADTPDGYKPTPDSIPIGKQTVGLSVEVIAPAVMNVNQAGPIRIIVRNTGVADARTVRVNYDLAKELTLITSNPEAHRIAPGEPGLQWVLNTVAAGSEQILTLKVKPTAVTSIDHAALVTLMVGGRSRTVVQEPMLKVEATVSPSKVLQGKQVQFRIAVSNPGSGPARNVVVRAKFSPGLRHQGEDYVEQTVEVIQAKERIELDALDVDTLAGGEQTCTITAMSTDIADPSADAKVVRSVVVLRPELALDLIGPDTRFTDTLAEYKVVLDNPGTAAARNVKVVVTLPAGTGRLQTLPPGMQWTPSTNRITWTIPNIEPKAKSTSSFRVRMGSVGAYRVVAEAKAGGLSATDFVSTSVSGMVDIDLNVSEPKRVFDVGETTIFYAKLKNVGTKSAKNILVRAKLSPNIEFVDSTVEWGGSSGKDTATEEIVFTALDVLPVGREYEVTIKVKGLKPGSANCRFSLIHDDSADPSARIEDVAQTRVMPGAETSLK